MIKPIEIKGNVVWVADGYGDLPSIKCPDGTVYTCWQLDADSLEELKKNGGKIYVSMLTFNEPLIPIKLMTSLDEDIELI